MADDDKQDSPAKDEKKPDPDGMSTDAGKKALDAERAKVKALAAEIAALKPLADAAKKAEEDKLGEVERLQKQINDLTRERDDATSDATRYKVALDKGLTLTRAKRLVGATEEELAADADELLADLADTKPPPGRRPQERLRGGGDPDETPEELDPDKLAAAISRAH